MFKQLSLEKCWSQGGLAGNCSDFIWLFLPPYMGVIPNPKMAFIFPISCTLVLIFPIYMTYFPKCEGKGSFQKSQIKPLESKRKLTLKGLAARLPTLLVSTYTYVLKWIYRTVRRNPIAARNHYSVILSFSDCP